MIYCNHRNLIHHQTKTIATAKGDLTVQVAPFDAGAPLRNNLDLVVHHRDHKHRRHRCNWNLIMHYGV